jgi:glycosyltransferase involved in cell wall biosynthesis
MKITFVLPTVNMSGGIRVVAIYAKALSKMGHEVVLISPTPAVPSIKAWLKSVFQAKGWPKSILQPKSHLDGLGVAHRVLRIRTSLQNKDTPDADVVIATWWETAEWVGHLAQSKGTKVYFVQHHEVFENLPIDRARATYRLPLHKIVIAQWLKNVMALEYGDFNVDLVPNSVDTRQFFSMPRMKQSRPTIGFLFSNASFKGVDVSLRALGLIKDVLPDVRIVSFGAQHPVDFPGWRSDIEFEFSPAQDRLREIYAMCDVWIAASRSEGFNLPAMEAMACRTPVVSTKAGWPEEAIQDGVNGYLVDVDDYKDLADKALRILLLDSDRWKEMSDNALDTATSGSWAESAAQFEKILIQCTKLKATTNA